MEEHVAATRMNLQIYKEKYATAKKGYDLLKRKADALRLRFRDTCRLIYDTKLSLPALASDAYFSLTQAEYVSGPFFHSKIIETDRHPEIYVKSHTENVMGIRLPVLQFAHIVRPNSADKFLGLTGGGHKIQACRDRFIEYLHALIHLATLQASFYTINEALKVTSRRVHAIEHLTLPKFEAVLAYIRRELDELEREEFTRMKLVKKHKEECGEGLSKLSKQQQQITAEEDEQLQQQRRQNDEEIATGMNTGNEQDGHDKHKTVDDDETEPFHETYGVTADDKDPILYHYPPVVQELQHSGAISNDSPWSGSEDESEENLENDVSYLSDMNGVNGELQKDSAHTEDISPIRGMADKGKDTGVTKSLSTDDPWSPAE